MTADPLDAFLVASTAPRDHHASGTLAEAEAIRAAHADLAARSIYAAAVLGDEVEVRRHIAANPSLAIAKGGVYGWDALTYLCFSRYLRLDAARGDGFVASARALLDAGASANTGWFEESHQPEPAFESAIYGAAGIAHHVGLSRLLLERGADPNDDETPYHTPETYDNGAMQALVESGRMTPASLATLLIRKADWHDFDGMKWLLAHGVDPNLRTRWKGSTALHHAILRDNRLEIVRLLLDRGADPSIVSERGTAVALAARRGRRDVLVEFIHRGIALDVHGADRVFAACAMSDADTLRQIAVVDRDSIDEAVADGGAALGAFAGNGNVAGIVRLLELGVPVDASVPREDGYWGLADGSTPLHVASWRSHPDVVRLLLERGAAVNARDASGRTPLVLAVKACVDSYWMERRTPQSVAALLHAGASPAGIPVPTGYDEIDVLLRP